MDATSGDPVFDKAFNGPATMAWRCVTKMVEFYSPIIFGIFPGDLDWLA